MMITRATTITTIYNSTFSNNININNNDNNIIILCNKNNSNNYDN